MIVVNCSQCKARLEMDDAFAGGVCRCHFCGTIQTVPAAAKRQAGKPSPPATSSPSTAPAAKAPGAKAGDGLDALAAAAAARGTGEPRPAPAAPPIDYARPPHQKKLGAPMIVALCVIALLALILGWLLVASPTPVATVTTVSPTPNPVIPSPTPGTPSVPPDGGGDETPPPAAPATPNFCGIDLHNAGGVVYVLDRGQATADLFDALKEATYRSVESLGPGKKFQIIFWDNGGDVAAYPADGLAEASPREVEAARQQFADLIAGGRTSPDDALRRAVQGRPAAIVLVTAKAFDLEQGLVKQAQLAVKGTSIKVHTVALKSDDGNPVLKDIADRTHGEFRVVSARELRKASE